MLKNRNFLLYSSGRFVSLIGTGIQDIALALFVLDITGSGAMMGLFLIMSMVPRLVLIPFAGVVGDSWNRKNIMVWMDYGRGALILGLAILAVNGMITIPILLGAQFLAAIMGSMFGPATSAMLPDLVDEEQFTRANSVMGSINSLSMIIGPVIGGIFYGIGGIMFALLFNGISFLASGFSEMFIDYHQDTKKLGSVKNVIKDLKEGFNFIIDRRAITIMMVFILILNFLINPMFQVLLPYVMRVVIGFTSTQYGFLQSTFLGGLLIGNITIGVFFSKKSSDKLITRGLILQMALTTLFVIMIFPNMILRFGGAGMTLFGLFGALFIGIGTFNAYVNTPFMTTMQKLVPANFRSRVFSVLEVMSQGIVPIGIGIVGMMLDIIPAHYVGVLIVSPAVVLSVFFVGKYSKPVFKALNRGISERKKPEVTKKEVLDTA